MRYAILIYDEETANPSPEPPDPAVWGQVIEEYNAYSQMLRDTGAYAGGEALQQNPTATTIRIRDGQTIISKAVDSCFFPLYEVERGITNITYDPEDKNKRIPVSEWLKMMGKTRHLNKPEHAEILKAFEDEIERRWRKLKAKHESPYL